MTAAFQEKSTGHKDPAIPLHMLGLAEKNNFRFDTVRVPLNVMDAHYKSFQHKVLPVLLNHRIGVLGMKPLDSEVDPLLAKTAEPSQTGEFEPLKTTEKYDATAQHPAFLD